MNLVARSVKYFAALAVVYLILVVLLPDNKNTMHNYNLNAKQYHILLFVVILPQIALWFTAFFGAAKLSTYAETIKKSKEGKNFDQIARGITWLAWGLPLTALTSLVLSSIGISHNSFHPADIILVNYLSLVIPLIAYSLLRRGASGLTQKSKGQAYVTPKVIMALFVVFGVGYCFLIFRRLDLQSLSSSNNPYFLPVWLMIFSIIIPYLYAWFSGILAAYEIILYSRKIPGVLYRRAVQILAAGLLAIIASSVSSQYIRSVAPRTGHLSLNITLLLANIFYVFLAVGFILVVIGANRLKKIEEV